MVLKVKVERVSRDIKFFVFAQMLGVDPQRWRDFEMGKLKTPQDVADKAAEILGVPVEELFRPVELKPVP